MDGGGIILVIVVLLFILIGGTLADVRARVKSLERDVSELRSRGKD